MPSHLRFPGRSIPATSLTSRRLHSAALTQVPDTPATSINSPAKQSSSPSTPLRNFSTAVTRHIKIQSLTESLPSPSIHHHGQIATMATMPATRGHSEACCNIPPIVSSGYVPKGTYEQLGGMKTCEGRPSHIPVRGSQLTSHQCRCDRSGRRHQGPRLHIRHLRLFRPDSSRGRYSGHEQ